MGGNVLGGVKRESILKAYRESLGRKQEKRISNIEHRMSNFEGLARSNSATPDTRALKSRRCRVPPLWDGKAAERIWEVLESAESIAHRAERISN